ncbi:MAG: TIGR02757 family protein [Ignavibacteriales bacterium]|nr:MAG: TIGR02757 family protein [Ignavibacteriales bacterium]
MNHKTLKQKLEYHFKAFDKTQIEPDPLQFLHLYKKENDIEVMGFLSSIFAYGNVKQILNTLNALNSFLQPVPYKHIIALNSRYKINLKHRFYSEADVNALFILLNKTIKKHGSLKELFLNGYTSSDVNVKNGITNFSQYFLEEYLRLFGKPTHGIKFMFPSPEKGSACKRMNLFLRWMVRKDELDFGIWNEIPADKLIIPVDTHIAKISKHLKLTSQKNVSWKMAEEITHNLKKFDADDPVKYDFALCHIGMRKIKF